MSASRMLPGKSVVPMLRGETVAGSVVRHTEVVRDVKPGLPHRLVAWVFGKDDEERRRVADLFAAAQEMQAALEELDPANLARTDCNERKCESCTTCRARAAVRKSRGER